MRFILPLVIMVAFGAGVAPADVIPLGLGQVITDIVPALGGNFIVEQSNHHTTGTGVIDPFLTVQDNGNEQGFNTSLDTFFDEKREGGGFTRALLLSEIPIVEIGGVPYREFLLDLHEPDSAAGRYISLNQVQLFLATGDTTFTSQANANSSVAAAYPVLDLSQSARMVGGITGTLIFQMASDILPHDLKLDTTLEPGSGWGDLFFYVPSALFGTDGSRNVIMYSQFGVPPGGSESEATFEEWAVQRLGSTTEVPEPATILGLGTVLFLLGSRLRRKKA